MECKEIAGSRPRSGNGRSDEEQEYYDSLGPWATERAVCEALGYSAHDLALQRQDRRVLGVQFDDAYYYPVQQFDQGHVVAGLAETLQVLTTGFVTPDSQAGWLAEKAYVNDEATRWDVLRTGNVSTVLQWAKDDAASVSRP